MGCNLRLIQRLRLDQVADSFSLGEIDAPIEERAHGEFAGLGQASPSGEGKINHVSEDHWRTVSRDFDDVIGGVGVRFGKVSHHHVINALTLIVVAAVLLQMTRPRESSWG